jgi:putative oxidoreductase
MIRRITGLHNSFVALLNYLQTPLLFAIRIFWGWQFAQTGWGKLHRIPQVTEFFASLNLPYPHFTAIFCASVEFFGGILFALGLGTRVVSLMLFVNMTTAYWTADREAFFTLFSSDPDKFLKADPYTFWFAALIILIFGPGAWALDTLVSRMGRNRA